MRRKGVIDLTKLNLLIYFQSIEVLEADNVLCFFGFKLELTRLPCTCSIPAFIPAPLPDLINPFHFIHTIFCSGAPPSRANKRKRIFTEHKTFSEVQAGIREGRYHQLYTVQARI